ncbi:MAG: carboxypeptidase regulatory-like domain-containing protein [Edaphobacter sp.]|uniref:carboxypeptidase regulatory-like domain-containing protein n=1 Tax=Edaphobacter sp. TaxID=1934404 RepID=UPI00239843FF|nr:carboxypeptidase regulatory-like domain-containing protein [Edaphobacter sp.]MDE1177892.1 carboxypeptidase regulatory-like domain-containing protein [Edaphobacter sp.]
MQTTQKNMLAAGLAIAVTIGLAGCKPDRVSTKGAADGAAKAVAKFVADPNAGSVTGVVHFKGQAPARLQIDMTMDPACGKGAANLTEQYVVNNGGLANVYVYVKSGPAAAMQAGPMTSAPVVLDQVGCRYVPHVIAVMKGGVVEFRNSDGTMHNIHTMPQSNPGVDVSEGPKGAPEQRRFDTPEVMIPVRCNNHPWMNAFINVSATPFFAVTDADGRFSIEGLPPGTYTLAAVHEKLGEQTFQLTVASKSQATAEFTFAAQ